MIFALLAVVLVIIGAIHWYLWKRLVRDTTRTRRARRIGTAVAVVLALIIPATLALSRTLPHSRQPLVAWPGFLWLAIMFYLLVTLLILELPRLALRLWLRRREVRSGSGSDSGPVSGSDGGPGSGSGSDADSGSDVSSGSGSDIGSRVGSDISSDDGNVGNIPRGAGDISGSSKASGQGSSKASGEGSGEASDDQSAFAAAAPPRTVDETDERFDAGRRLLLGRSLAVTAGVLSASAVGIGVYQAMSAPNLKRVPIRLAKLPASMDGFRIALVSDIHLGPLLGRSHTERIVRMINGVGADLVAVVGDLVDGSVAELGAAAEPLQDLRAKHGSFFVTGNHEYFSGYQEWVDEVNSLGVRVLRNERVDVLGLDLAGVNDVSGGDVGDGPDFGKALDGRDAARPVVLLAHQPVQAHEAARHGVDLQLSGHTHGGQMVPFNLLVGLQQPVVAGLGNVDGTQVYVTRGAGFWGPPVRFGAPPDISVVELHGA
ncbi:metallophosphoesterase [Dactylosporangium darangshiense]|uniref:Calcineurin-like phosphoesterase domain-containing protein n=1 Tax=Dactylosporangium darangshiense TaxID=579108 RepID=A0ABP8CVT4_9ACTN